MRTLIVAIALSITACGPKPASPGPATPAATTKLLPEQRFDTWLALFNAGDAAAMTAAYPGLFVDPPPVERDAEFRQMTGGFTVKRIETATAEKFVAILGEHASEQLGRVEIVLETVGPRRIAAFGLRAIPTPDDLAPARLDEAGALAALRAELDKQVAADQFSGAVMIAKDGRPVFAQAYGEADRAAHVANTVDTRFRIGSMNKMFTATAMVRLALDGRVKLDATLATVLPDYPNQELARKVTFAQLLSHTGGTGDIFTPEYEAKRLQTRTIADYVALFGARALAYEPGTRWEYSNYGFILLGAAIEKLTGKTYYDAVQELVFAPAGMTSTSSPPEDVPMAGRSVGYLHENPKASLTSNVDTLPYRGTSAGGGDSTVGDLVKFATALRAHKLLDAEHTALLTTGKVKPTPDDDSELYAYGFQDLTRGRLRCVGHNGGAPGMNGELYVCDNAYTIAVLANLDPPAASRIAEFIRLRLPLR